jgi:hypothetical protein
MRTFALRPDAPDQSPAARRRRFSASQRVIAANDLSSDFSISPGPETRYGLSLAHNDAFATIARSTFLTCTFAPTPETFANPLDSRLFRSVRFRGRTGAKSTPGTRYPRRFPTLLIFSRSPLPFGSSFENPPDQSVQPVPCQEARLTKRSIVPCSPPLPLAIPLQLALGVTQLETRFVRLNSSFRKPWN